MPARVCLGDILAGQGYRQAFFVGADAEFGGLGDFVRAHAVDEVHDLAVLRPRDPDDTHKWGMHDAVLFAAALDRISGLEAEGAPYFVSIETIGPHGPEGYISRACRKPGQSGVTDDILEAVACTARLTQEFIAQVWQLANPEDTLIVVLSDHLAHPAVRLTPELEHYQRRNTAFALGAGISPGNLAKPATMVDLYPTILELMGYQLAERRAGLGVLIMSDAPGLAALPGMEDFEGPLARDLPLARLIWGRP